MSGEFELISDGDGIAVIGDPSAVDQFLSSAGVASRDLDLQRRVGSTLSAAASTAEAGSQIAATSGRWVQLTEQSAKAMKAGQLMKGTSSDVSRAVLTDGKGKVSGLLEIMKTTPAGMLTNPAVLAGAAGIMAQLAMQQTMEEITDYLATINGKVDDILRSQKDAALAQLVGVGFVVDEAMTIRDEVGRVSDVTWSKVQATSQTIAQTQAYALLQLDALAEKLETTTKTGQLAKTTKQAESKVGEWLAVLARCFQLSDAIAVLELDRVLAASPAEIDQHRIGLQMVRRKRRDHISRTTERLVARIDAAAVTSNMQVLLHPQQSGAVIRSSNNVVTSVVAFNQRLGIESGRQALEVKRWITAAGEVRDGALESGADGVEAARRLGNRTLDTAKNARSRLSNGLRERLRRGRRSDPDPPDATR